MPIYAAQWRRGHCPWRTTIVNAADTASALWRLDEEEDPSGVEIKRLPLSMEIAVELKPDILKGRDKTDTNFVKPRESTLSSDFSWLFEKSEMSDITIKTSFPLPYNRTPKREEDNDSVRSLEVYQKENSLELKAHKIVLCARSKYYRMMFNGKYQEGRGVIECQDFSCATMREMLRYLYTDKVKFDNHGVEDMELSLELLALANKLQLERLVEVCEEHIHDYYLEFESGAFALQIAYFAKEHSAKRLYDAAMYRAYRFYIQIQVCDRQIAHEGKEEMGKNEHLVYNMAKIDRHRRTLYSNMLHLYLEDLEMYKDLFGEIRPPKLNTIDWAVEQTAKDKLDAGKGGNKKESKSGPMDLDKDESIWLQFHTDMAPFMWWDTTAPPKQALEKENLKLEKGNLNPEKKEVEPDNKMNSTEVTKPQKSSKKRLHSSSHDDSGESDKPSKRIHRDPNLQYDMNKEVPIRRCSTPGCACKESDYQTHKMETCDCSFDHGNNSLNICSFESHNRINFDGVEKGYEVGGSGIKWTAGDINVEYAQNMRDELGKSFYPNMHQAIDTIESGDGDYYDEVEERISGKWAKDFKEAVMKDYFTRPSHQHHFFVPKTNYDSDEDIM